MIDHVYVGLILGGLVKHTSPLPVVTLNNYGFLIEITLTVLLSLWVIHLLFLREYPRWKFLGNFSKKNICDREHAIYISICLDASPKLNKLLHLGHFTFALFHRFKSPKKAFLVSLQHDVMFLLIAFFTVFFQFYLLLMKLIKPLFSKDS